MVVVMTAQKSDIQWWLYDDQKFMVSCNLSGSRFRDVFKSFFSHLILDF